MAVLALRAGFRLPAGAVRRALIAGIAWGVPMAALIVARQAWDCGVLCLSEAAVTLAISTAAGVLTFGPLAAIASRTRT
jgi:hypothetical protein